MTIALKIRAFFDSDKANGIVLIACTLISLLIANSPAAPAYHHFWETKIAGLSLELWVNDGLMTIFFFLVGLELVREIKMGALSNVRFALLPIAAAIGGMIIPAGIYLLLNYGTDTQSGMGIPMATDIAFALGALSLLGSRVPVALKLFLTALAVIDDLGAIIVIALFYTKELFVSNLMIALGIFVFLLLLNKLGVKSLIPYLLGGCVMWFFMLNSGVHATITGVLLAFTIPIEGDSHERSPLLVLEHALHRPVAFIILPIFALANTAITVSGNFAHVFTENYGIGIALGLILGKPIGITLFSYIAVLVKLCKLPENVDWGDIFGVSMLGGIGFTMSIFITLLAFNDATHINNAKLVILISSLIAAVLGLLTLNGALKRKRGAVG